MAASAKVTLAMPLEGHVAAPAVASLGELVFKAVEADLLDTMMFGHHWLSDAVRNSIVNNVLQDRSAATHVMWLDPDLIVPPSVLTTLLAHDQQIVGGLYPRRLDKPPSPAYSLDPFRWLDAPITELKKVDGFGLGCALVRADVYRQMRERYKDTVWHQRSYGHSEDVAFFERCRAMEVAAHIDPSVECTYAPLSDATAMSVVGDRHASDGGPRVAMAVPLFEAVSPMALMSLMNLIQTTVTSGLVQGLFFTNNLYLDVARNTLVRDVLKSSGGFTHLLWVDSDMTVPTDALDRLLSADRPIVGGLYHAKTRGATPAVFTVDPVHLVDEPFEGLTRVDGFGLGCTLVQRSVYEEMSTAYGDDRWHEVRDWKGDDVFFFERCKEMGIPVWLDASLRCGHVTDYAVTTAHWKQARARTQPNNA